MSTTRAWQCDQCGVVAIAEFFPPAWREVLITSGEGFKSSAQVCSARCGALWIQDLWDFGFSKCVC